MARKSRKNVFITAKIHQEESSCLMTAIYVRLSVENSGKDDDGDSITNQITFCKNYLREHPELKLYDIYKDNGETGTNFDRPEFRRLMDDVKSSKIKCIVVKDLSRFGRNYIETGEYLEKIFPFLGVRFIAITDNYDSATSTSAEATLMIPLKNIINDAYAKDISRKIITAFKAKQEKGEFRQPFPPYGYVKSQINKYRYEIDDKTAPYVKMIFQWKALGLSYLEICKRLDNIGAITPAERKVELGIRNKKEERQDIWCKKSATILKILTNPTYIGCVIYGRTKQSLYEGIKRHETKESEWLILPSMHEPIISQELFNKVQNIIEKNKEIKTAKREQTHEARVQINNLFKGKIYCADCGRKMLFIKTKNKSTKEHSYKCTHFECGGYPSKKCTSHRSRYLIVYNAVLSAIQKQLEIALEREKFIKRLKESSNTKNLLNFHLQTINQITLNLQQVNVKREQLFENFVSGILDKSEYQFLKQKYDETATTLQQQLVEITQKKEHIEHILSEKSQWLTILHSIEGVTVLDQGIIDSMIKRIYIYKNTRMEIEFNYKEEKQFFEKILQELIEGRIS